MKTALLCLIMLFCVGSIGRAEKAEVAFREIRLRVLDLDGSPAGGRSVILRGLSRGSTQPAEAPWEFTTDAAGRLSLRLINAATWEDPEKRPGWGNYAVIVDPKKDRDAGAASPILMNVGGRKESTYGGDRSPGYWGVPLLLPDDGVDLTLQIVKGATVEGVVWDYEEITKPLKGAQVNLFLNLGSESHTGYGGEVFHQQVTTDEQGRYQFSHVYPGEVFLSLGELFAPVAEPPGQVWLRTRPEGEDWVDEPFFGRLIWSGRQSIDLAVAQRNLFRYWGKVTDAKGQPIARAKITFGVSANKRPETHVDSHFFNVTFTGQDGRYEIMLPTPWATGMSASFGDENRDDRWEGPYAPGEYHFQLKGTSGN